MKLATFSDGRPPRVGVVVDDMVVDICDASPAIPRDMIAFLTAGPSAIDAAERATRHAARKPLSKVRLYAPLLTPPEFLIVGANYADHAAEGATIAGLPPGLDEILQNKGAGQEVPIIVNKQSSCVNGPFDPIHMPRISEQLDYEGELGFVIGKACKNVTREQAAEYIAGYLVIDDVSVRDWQFKSPTFTLGKSFDTHGPIGPWIVTPDEIGDPHALDIATYVNGELRQHSNTRHLIFDCFHLVSLLSTIFTLKPGTIISTGTCAGVGVAMNPPCFLKVGDVVEVRVEKIGSVRNEVVPEP